MENLLVEVTVAMFSTMLAGGWYLHREIRKSREETTRLMKDQISQFEDRLTSTMNLLWHEVSEHKRVTENNHQQTQRQLEKMGRDLASSRECLAYIRGHLRLGASDALPRTEPED